MPCRATTVFRTCWIRASMSAAVAPPVLMMKLACFGETSAPPMRAPFRPATSIRRAAWSPGGILEHRAAAREPDGLACLAFRDKCPDAVRSRGVVLVELESGSQEPLLKRTAHVPVTNLVAVPSAGAHFPATIYHVDLDELPPGFAAESPRIHPERPTDAARNTCEELGLAPAPTDCTAAPPPCTAPQPRPRRPRHPDCGARSAPDRWQ